MRKFWRKLVRSESTQEPVSKTSNWFQRHPALTAASAIVLFAGLGTFFSIYRHYARLIDEKLGDGGVRTNTAIYAAPKLIAPGDSMPVSELVARLQGAGYTEHPSNPIGWYRAGAERVEITSGTQSYFQPQTAVVSISDGKIELIFSKTENKTVERYWLEPQLITNLSDSDRGKRRPVPYSELPKHMVEALISIEDKRFFSHNGLDGLRLLKAAYVDLKERRKDQGASTLTMQLARSFWLEQDKTWRRKLSEVMLTAELERRFSKEKILELYANEVYLGRRGSFSIHGFGEAARAYLNKDVRDLTVGEAAMLAGMIQRPAYFNPFRYPDRVKDRRNLTLTLMLNNGHITADQFRSAAAEPIRLSPGETESSDAPYFVDLLNNELQNRTLDLSSNAYRIYSTLDLDLQQKAVEAIRGTMPEVDRAIQRKRGKNRTGAFPQIALVALDPRTGALRALVGGRNYAESQLNRSEAKRQPGSTFKPLVYAAALNTAALSKRTKITTTATRFTDEPTAFRFNKQTYEPTNFHNEYHGDVTMRQALAKSMNIPSIKAAERAGYATVASLAKSAGVESEIQATPSIALGSYDMSPLELAETYTIFTNNGAHVKQMYVSSIRDRTNRTVFSAKPESNQVIDPRVAYIMSDLMSEVLRSGTAAGARARGFTLPASGKTGTSRDGWFVGYTSNLLCAVWIGYDDNSELELEGSKSAMPVWAEFMKRAHTLRQYANPQPFAMPAGIVKASIDPVTGGLANEYCPSTHVEMFLSGTQPKEPCTEHDEFHTGDTDPDLAESGDKKPDGVLGRILGSFAEVHGVGTSFDSAENRR